MPNPYNYNYSEDTQSYYFITKNEIEYRIAFVIDETFSAVSGLEIENVYQMIIEKITDDVERFDLQTSETIKDIVNDFFANSQHSMIYVCDDADQKGEKRFHAFERWYRSSTLTESISKEDNVIVCDETTLYTSLLYHNDNVNKIAIVEIYRTIQEILNEK